MRRFIVLLACIFLTVGVAGQATAAPTGRRTAPTAPTGLAVSPAAALSATVSWKTPGSSGSSKILGYTITSKAENKRYPTVAVAPANSQSKVIKNLTAGISYTISVTAWNSAGRSPAATVKYTVPSATSQFLFTFDTTVKAIVKVPVTGGSPVTVAAGFGNNPVRFAVDKPGNAYILDTVAKTVVKVPVSGPKTTLRSGLSAPTDLQLDGSGRVYVLDGSKVIRLAATGSPEKVIGQAPAGFPVVDMFVAANGTVNILSEQNFEVNLVTITATGQTSTRSVAAGHEGYYLGMIGDQIGNLYFNVASPGGSGYRGWNKLPAGSSTQVNATPTISEYAATMGPNNQFFLFTSVKWCVGMSQYIPDENGEYCVPDYSVPEVLKTASDGTSTSVAIQGFTLESLGGVVVDTAGNIYVARSSGPSAGILKYAPTGGAPVVLATGTFTQAATNG